MNQNSSARIRRRQIWDSEDIRNGDCNQVEAFKKYNVLYLQVTVGILTLRYFLSFLNSSSRTLE
jgi:hypothetical protein